MIGILAQNCDCREVRLKHDFSRALIATSNSLFDVGSVDFGQSAYYRHDLSKRLKSAAGKKWGC